ncbi:HPr family phosphocarrier protein [Actinomadura sp. HBU206391]|uniref:HPr family phosphocarrier protein n=1 Tax=Actinomadura sp. HBU206391 TaxID=2731692 RepID=UPI00164F5896|nr:HPr family phosphocarrier protein [Actinomadura sp. HBU206391]MBC6456791.1 HPr family phosphocarrier protein [Actinomadura sp. HBU206391]
MAERRVKVASSVGLHARPAALFVQAAARVPVDVGIARPDGDPVNAKSILAVLGLDVRQGEEILIIVGDGEDTTDADVVLNELEELVSEPEGA